MYPKTMLCPTGKHPRAKLSKWPQRAANGWYTCKCIPTYWHHSESKKCEAIESTNRDPHDSSDATRLELIPET